MAVIGLGDTSLPSVDTSAFGSCGLVGAVVATAFRLGLVGLYVSFDDADVLVGLLATALGLGLLVLAFAFTVTSGAGKARGNGDTPSWPKTEGGKRVCNSETARTDVVAT